MNDTDQLNQKDGRSRNSILRNISLRTKFSVLVATILLVSFSILAYVNIQSKQQVLLDNLENKGQMLTQYIAKISSDAAIAYNFETLDYYISDVTKENDVIFGVVLGPNGRNMTNFLDWENIDIKNAIKETNSKDVLTIVNNIETKKNVLSYSADIHRNRHALNNDDMDETVRREKLVLLK